MDPSEIAPKSADAGAVSDSPTSEDLEFGFRRPEMYQGPLSRTFNPKDRHLFLCHNGPTPGPPASKAPTPIPSPASSPTPSSLARATRSSTFLKSFRGLTEEDVDSFVDEVLVKVAQWSSGKIEPLVGSHVFVCCHGSRDHRCGVCGPALIKKFQEEIESQDLKGEVFVSPCSHVGGHKYAGNIIIFSSIGGKVTGHWYGYVTPDDVPILLDQHIAKGEIIERLWSVRWVYLVNHRRQPRSKMLIEREKLGTERLQEDSNIGDGGVVSCCQGANGFSCCRDGVVLQEKGTTGGKATSSPAKKDCNVLTSWLNKWERSDTYATLAVIGAVASVTVAYSMYRHKRSS